jgi:hypothetical protein
MGHVELGEALELTALIAQKDPRRHQRAAARWLLRFLDETGATLDDSALAASALQSLTTPRHAEALALLRALCR